jgi:hypothetical protein
MSLSEQDVLAATRRWLMQAVIGLNLCPFAKVVYSKGQVRFAVSDADSAVQVLARLGEELEALMAAEPAVHDTTLLVTPHCLHEFLDFNDLVRQGERMIRKKGFEGVVQLASFHPDYRFADLEGDDLANCTNRSPYPTLHLLREASVEKAVQAFADPQAIYGANIRTLRELGTDGWAALDVGADR